MSEEKFSDVIWRCRQLSELIIADGEELSNSLKGEIWEEYLKLLEQESERLSTIIARLKTLN